VLTVGVVWHTYSTVARVVADDR